MPRRKKTPLPFAESMRKIAASQLQTNKEIVFTDSAETYLDSLEVRIKKLLGLVQQKQKNANSMLFFVMYDIESDKVRRLVSKYLERKGCSRIQRSIFLAEAPLETYTSIKADLAEVQAAYENNDSIIILPVSSDYLKLMKIIGQKIEVDIITHSRNTLFF